MMADTSSGEAKLSWSTSEIHEYWPLNSARSTSRSTSRQYQNSIVPHYFHSAKETDFFELSKEIRSRG